MCVCVCVSVCVCVRARALTRVIHTAGARRDKPSGAWKHDAWRTQETGPPACHHPSAPRAGWCWRVISRKTKWSLYTYMHICMYTYMHIYRFTYIYTYMHIYRYTYIYRYVFIGICICIEIIYVYAYIYLYVYAYI